MQKYKLYMILRSFFLLSLLFYFPVFLISSADPKIVLPLNLQLPDDPFWQEDALEANNNLNHFIEPSNDTNYADYRYVGAHNAHVYYRFFHIVRQQDQTILGHLSYGVRGLMLDTYDFTLGWPAAIRGPQGAKVCLSHGQPGFIAFTQKGHNSYQSLQYELRRIIEFMKRAPKAVITICLEDYANLAHTVTEIKAVVAAAGYDPIFKPTDWPAANNSTNQTWPTLGWMRAHNKRLVIFTQNSPNTAVTWKQYSHCIENQYSTTDENLLWHERPESAATSNAPRNVVIMNNFSDLAVTRATWDTKKQVSYTTVKRVSTNCQAKGFAKDRLFNGYYADRIVDSCNDLLDDPQKTIFHYVNELNAKTNKTLP
jgi:hypothetical protein